MAWQARYEKCAGQKPRLGRGGIFDVEPGERVLESLVDRVLHIYTDIDQRAHGHAQFMRGTEYILHYINRA